MKNLWLPVMVALSLVCIPFTSTFASPKKDLKEYRDYFKKKFPKVKFEEFANGVYALDADMRGQWEQIMEFPPYELALEEGEKLFKKKFKNGKTLASCFRKGGVGIAQEYPYFDTKSGKVKTLPLEINECLKKNREKPLKYKKGKMAAIVAYMMNTSRGKKFNVKIPNDKRALAAYEAGKKFYYARRGQLNFSCAHCHVNGAGNRIRTNLLSPGLGQPTNFPTYRSKWGELGTLHRRYTGCNKQVRAKPYKAQGVEYRNLEYFHTYMSNGLPLNAPGTRQ